MKKLNLFLSLFIVLFAVTSINAQISTSKSLKDDAKEQVSDTDFTSSILKALNPGKNFTSEDKYDKLVSSHKSLVSDVLGVMNGSGSEDEKMTKVKELTGKHKSFTEELLGKSEAKKYRKMVKKKIRPLKRKYQLAKLFL